MDFQQFIDEYNRLYKEENLLYHRLAKHFGLSDSTLWILYVLETARRPVTQTEVCDFLSISKQTIHSALKNLEQEGRIRLSSGPGRRKYIHLTRQGRDLTRRTIQPVLEMEERAFRATAERDRAGLLALSRRHLELLNRESEKIFNTSQEES